MTVIGNHNADYPILKKDGGKFRDEEVDALIGLYDTIGEFRHESLITKDMAYNEFSDDIEAAFCNKSIQRYITEIREEDRTREGPAAFFGNFDELAMEFLATDNKTCEDFD